MAGRFPVQVTNWLPTREEIDFCVEDFQRQKISFAVAHKNGAWSVWREKREGDPADIVVKTPPRAWTEVYIHGIRENTTNKKVA